MALASSSGLLDAAWIARVAYAEGLRLSQLENEAYRARFEEPVLAAGLGQRRAMELASELAGQFLPLVYWAIMGIFLLPAGAGLDRAPGAEHRGRRSRRPGALARPGPGAGEGNPPPGRLHPAHLERGDEAAAELAGDPDRRWSSALVAVAWGHPGEVAGDGVMLHFREPAAAVEASLSMVGQVPEAGLPPAHVGAAQTAYGADAVPSKAATARGRSSST